MQSSSYTRQPSPHARATSMNAGFVGRLPLLALATALLLGTGAALAQPAMQVKEDRAQLQADQAALVSEKAQLQADRKALKADTREGKMAAESPDAERGYQDQQAIKAQERQITADKAALKADAKK